MSANRESQREGRLDSAPGGTLAHVTEERTTREIGEWIVSATLGGTNYTIGENQYLDKNASTLSYEVTITVNSDYTWSYDETTMLKMNELAEPFAHTDHNTLRRVG